MIRSLLVRQHKALVANLFGGHLFLLSQSSRHHGTTQQRSYQVIGKMGKLEFPLDKELTGPDRIVLEILQKEYELYETRPAKSTLDAAEDSDDSGVKHSEIVTPSPEGQ